MRINSIPGNLIFMKLTKEQIEHIARLARLELTEEELEKYGNQLSAVLDYVGELSGADVRGIEPTAQVTGLENILRNDEIHQAGESVISESLAQAPEAEEGQIRVKRVLE